MNEVIFEKLHILNNIYNNSIGTTTNVIKNTIQSSAIKTELYNHQKAMINAMHTYRDRMTRGFLHGNQAINGKLGIIGDSAGTGKTLSVLGYISTLLSTYPKITTELVDNSSKYFFSHQIFTVPDVSCANLIIVPHQLFSQWKNEIATHTTLKYVAIDSKRVLKGDSIAELIVSSSFVLTTAKCYKSIEEYAQQYGIHWNNIFIDEATSIFISPSMPKLRFQFLWLITNNWLPLIFKYATLLKNELYALHILQDRFQLNNELKNWLLEPNSNIYEGTVVSSAFFKEYLPYTHNARYYMLLRNSKETLEASVKIPYITTDLIKCRPNISLNGLISYFSSRNLEPIIPENKIQHIYQALSIPIISLDEYLLSQPMHKYQLIRKKVDEGECMICLEKASQLSITNCCHNIYCGKCLLQNALINHKCPTCRDVLTPTSIVCIDEISPDERLISRTKVEACLDILRNNRTSKFIIFTTFSNVFYQIYNDFDKLGLKAERLENNLFSLLKTIKNFNEGRTQILCVSNIDLLRGVTLTGASHLIFYHEQPFYELRQVLIHSVQRIGKKAPLKVIHLNSELSI